MLNILLLVASSPVVRVMPGRVVLSDAWVHQLPSGPQQNIVLSGCSFSTGGKGNVCCWRALCPSALQVDDTDVINFLLSTEIIPLCLQHNGDGQRAQQDSGNIHCAEDSAG